MRVLLAGGGTGGHLYPLLSVAKKLQDLRSEKIEFLYVGPKNRFSQKILQEKGIKVKGILTFKWRRYFSLLNFLELLLFPIGLIQSLIIVLFFMPDVVFSKGGYGSIPPIIAARLYFIPILIHESDTVPGLANKVLSVFADKVAIYWETAQKYFQKQKVFLVGNPIREDINDGKIETAIQLFNLKNSKPVILILGGSQGSQFINEQIVGLLPELLNKYQIIHQIGDNNFAYLEQKAQEKNVNLNHEDYHLFEYLDEALIHAYKVSFLIISRAGATAISEIAAVAKPSILVPLSHGANNHQFENAYYVGKRGGAFVMEENNFKGELLLNRIDEIANNRILRENMSKAVNQLYFKNASLNIAQALLYLMGKG